MDDTQVSGELTLSARLDRLTETVEADTERVRRLADQRDQLRTALNAANAMNGVHERTIARLRGELEQAKLAPGPTGLVRVWSGYDDNERWHPFFAEARDAKAYAEQAFRASCAELDAGDPGEITWKERAARTGKVGYPDMFDLQSEVGGDGWVLCGVLVHPDLASGLRAQPLVVDEDETGHAEEYPGQTALPVEPLRGYRIGDLVQITARDSEGEHTPPGARLIGRTGYVSEIDDNPEYPIGLSIDGWLGSVWCNSGEIRHADAADGPDDGVDPAEVAASVAHANRIADAFTGRSAT